MCIKIASVRFVHRISGLEPNIKCMHKFVIDVFDIYFDIHDLIFRRLQLIIMYSVIVMYIFWRVAKDVTICKSSG